MGLWKCEVVRIDGDLFAYVENQDDWSGQITNGIRRVKNRAGKYEVLNMGSRLDVSDKVNALNRRESHIKEALEFYERMR